MIKTFVLVHDQARKGVAQFAMSAPTGLVVTFKEPKRSTDQNAKYHVMLQEIADQFEFCERKWDAEDIKRLCIDQFKRDTITDPEIKPLWDSMGNVDLAPSLDKTGVVALGTQSRKFPKKLAIFFIEWLSAFGAQNGVRFSV